jgi:Fe2+ transport system protein B
MADFFNKLKQTLDKGAKVVATKSSSAIDTTKLRAEIASLSKKKQELLLQVGRLVYENRQGSFDMELVALQMTDIEALDTEIAEKENQIEIIKEETDAKLSAIHQPTVSEVVEDVAEKVEDVVEEVAETVEDIVESIEEEIDKIDE